MKNWILGIVVIIVLIFGGIYVLNNSHNVEVSEAADEFGRTYGIEEHIYVPIDPDTLIEKMNNEETMILFIGRSSCPYCMQTVPVLNDSAVEYGYDEIHYMNSELDTNALFLDAQGIQSVPFTAFIQDGVTVFTLPGFVEADVMDQIFSELHKTA